MNNSKVLLIGVLISFLSFKTNAQQKSNKKLLKIDNSIVYTNEFINVYEKNLDIVTDAAQKDVRNYLELYIDYKLKLIEAYQTKLDTFPKYKKELKGYRDQLIKPYLRNTKVTDALLQEAYFRTKNEVKASHILLMVDKKATPEDTLKIFKQILKIRKTIVKNEQTFAQAAKLYSEDPSAKDNNGSLGYFSAFQMVYAFEDVVYKTKINEVSMPFRTQFGYHIIKVNDVRESRGKVEVAHIVIKGKEALHKQKIEDFYKKTKQGEDFAYLAQKYSDDKATAKGGGKLNPFGAGKMIFAFEKASFDLKEVGDISEPFLTPYGYHIVKLLKRHPIASFDKLKNKLVSKIERDERSQLINKSLTNKLRKELNITVNTKVRDSVIKLTKVNFSNRQDNKVQLAQIENKVYYTSNFANFLKVKRKNASMESFVGFMDENLLDFYKENLENYNKDFAATYTEYKDGLLLFELLQKQIWEPSEKDTLKVKAFFEKNKQNYRWNKRYDLNIVTSSSNEVAQKIKTFLEAGKSESQIKEILNTKDVQVLFKSGVIEITDSGLPTNYKQKIGVSDIYNDQGRFVVVKLNKVLEPKDKTFDKVRGKVVSDYQENLEKEWIASLRKKHKIKIYKKALKNVAKSYHQ